MTKPFITSFSALFLLACSENIVTINNETEETVHFNFRGERHIIAKSKESTITDIPNGTYTYSTAFVVTDDKSISEGNGLSGNLTFQQGSTSILIIYYYTNINSDSSMYTIGATVTSTDPVARLVASP